MTMPSMQMPRNKFKEALLAKRPQIGFWSSLCSNIVTEVIAGVGFDWILIDTEHAPNELPAVLSQLQSMTGGTAEPVVRPAWNDTVLLKRLLDIGTQNFLIPYVRNADGPNSWDCSGLTMAAWGSVGVSLPHSSGQQYNRGRPVARADLQLGDLVFFYSGITHVAIYAGGGRVIHAPHPGKSVEYIKISYMPYAGARRPG